MKKGFMGSLISVPRCKLPKRNSTGSAAQVGTGHKSLQRIQPKRSNQTSTRAWKGPRSSEARALRRSVLRSTERRQAEGDRKFKFPRS